jgi:hypothetical protein
MQQAMPPGGMQPGMPPGPGMSMGAAPARQQMARIDPAQIPRPVVNQSQEVQVGCEALWQQ